MQALIANMSKTCAWAASYTSEHQTPCLRSSVSVSHLGWNETGHPGPEAEALRAFGSWKHYHLRLGRHGRPPISSALLSADSASAGLELWT